MVESIIYRNDNYLMLFMFKFVKFISNEIG